MREDIKAFLKSALSHKQEDGPCLKWPFSCNSWGYAIFKLNRKQYKVANFICKAIYGKRPNKHVSAHSCHNKACCRPAHLRWASLSENSADQRTSLVDSKYKLTIAQVNAIKADKRIQREIAKEYGISRSQVSHIQTGKRWQ